MLYPAKYISGVEADPMIAAHSSAPPRRRGGRVRQGLRGTTGPVLALLLLLAGPAGPPPAGAAGPAPPAAPDPGPVLPAPPVTVRLNGQSQPDLPRAAVEALPAQELTVAFQTEAGEARARYTGALLWDVLGSAGLLGKEGKHPELHQFAVITGSDGYFIVVLLGEIAPAFGAVPMLLAYARDGAPLPPEQGLRLVVPGDSRGARSVRTLSRIDVFTMGANQ